MTRQLSLLFALSLCLASVGPVGTPVAVAADQGPGACCVYVQDLSQTRYAGAGKLNVGDGFVASNRDDAPGGPGGKSRNLGSLSGIGSTNELGRAGFAGGSGNPSAPGFPGGVRVAVGDVDGAGGTPQGTSGRLTGVAVDPSDPGGNAAGGAPAGERHFNGVVSRVSQGKVDDAGDGNTVYVGGANGGVWKTTDGGANAPGQDTYYGTGVYKSTDGGQTWQQGHNTGALRSVSNGNAAAAGGANGGVWKTTNFLTATPSIGPAAPATDSRPGVGVLKSMDGGRSFNQPVVTQGLKVK